MADELGQQQDIQQAQGVLETREDAGKGAQGEVTLWKQQIDLATKEEDAWVKRASETIDIYRDASDRRKKRYNILYANTEVMSQAVYNSRALPDVRARYNEADQISKLTAVVLERSLEYATDDSEHDFDQVIKNAVKDVLLPGRCVDRIRYHPVIEKQNKRVALVPGPNGAMMRVDTGAYLDPGDEWKTDDKGDSYLEGESYEAITYEFCYAEHVQWADFRRGPGKTWDEVPWVAFRHYLTRDQVIELNEKIGETISLDSAVQQDGKYNSADNGTAPSPNIFKRLCVWEVWDKEKRKVIWFAPSYETDLLRKDDDPLNLAQFFPIPRPIYAVEVPETLVPVEPYRLYKDQADELDTITRRLTALTRAAKWRGIYAMPQGGTTLTTLQAAQDGDLVPSQEAMSALATGSGLGDYIWMMPVKELAEVINLLTMRQEQIKMQIYEIMGIADILRGNSESRETATTSRVKAQWGSIRLQHLQQEVQRYVRDLFRLMAEVISEKYQPNTLQLITGLQIPPEVVQILHSDAMRCFKVDIETDSTIQSDLQRFQENATAFIAGTAQFFSAIGPAVEAGAIPAQSALDIFKGFARMFKLPKQAMDTIENLQAPPKQPDQGEQAKQQTEIMRAQADVQKTQIEGQNAQIQGAVDAQRAQQDGQLAQAAHGMKMTELVMTHEAKMKQLAAQAATSVIKAKASPPNAAGRA